MFRDVGSKKGIGESLAGLAGVAVEEGEPERAARLLGAAEGVLDTLGVRFEPAGEIEFGTRVNAARTALGDEAFAAAGTAGRTMTLDRAIEYALVQNEPAEPARQGPSGRRPDDEALTAREREIVGLVARGLTNRAIAATLVVSGRTVDAHVQNILNKLAFNSRAQIAAWAVERGLKDDRKADFAGPDTRPTQARRLPR